MRLVGFFHTCLHRTTQYRMAGRGGGGGGARSINKNQGIKPTRPISHNPRPRPPFEHKFLPDAPGQITFHAPPTDTIPEEKMLTRTPRRVNEVFILDEASTVANKEQRIFAAVACLFRSHFLCLDLLVAELSDGSPKDRCRGKQFTYSC